MPSVTNDSERTALLAAIGVTHGALDVQTTRWNVALSGAEVEANPVMHAVLTNAPGWVFTASVFAGIAAIAACIWYIDHVDDQPRIGTWVCCGLAVLGVAVVLNNLYWLLRASGFV